MDVFSWNGADADSLSDQVLHVWSRSLGPIDDPARWRTERWDRHRSREGFRLVTAHHFGDVVGFAYGYTGELGQYWSDWVVDELGPAVDGWIGGHFEFTKLASCQPSVVAGLVEHCTTRYSMTFRIATHCLGPSLGLRTPQAHCILGVVGRRLARSETAIESWGNC